MLSVIMLNVVMLNAANNPVMLSVAMLNFIRLNVVMLCVLVPFYLLILILPTVWCGGVATKFAQFQRNF
jgi:hypothetical protein